MKPTDLDLHCLQRQGISGFSRTWVRFNSEQVHVLPDKRTDRQTNRPTCASPNLGPEVIKLFFMLNSVEHEICPAYTM